MKVARLQHFADYRTLQIAHLVGPLRIPVIVLEPLDPDRLGGCVDHSVERQRGKAGAQSMPPAHLLKGHILERSQQRTDNTLQLLALSFQSVLDNPLKQDCPGLIARRARQQFNQARVTCLAEIFL